VFLGHGLTGAWLAATLHILVLSTALVLRFRSNAWQKIRI